MIQDIPRSQRPAWTHVAQELAASLEMMVWGIRRWYATLQLIAWTRTIRRHCCMMAVQDGGQ